MCVCCEGDGNAGVGSVSACISDTRGLERGGVGGEGVSG